SLCVANDTALTLHSSPALHDALPISRQQIGHEINGCLRDRRCRGAAVITSGSSLKVLPFRLPGQDRLGTAGISARADFEQRHVQDRKSTRLNSSHVKTSYAVFCLKNK